MAALLSPACGEKLPPIRYHTDQAIIGTTFSQSICPDDLRWLDEHIDFVERSLDAVSEQPIEIYLYDGPTPQCRVHGCYTDDGYIASNWALLDHEVVHAVVDRFANPPAFWNEGIAETFRMRGNFRGWEQRVTANVSARHSFDVDYATAGHFTRWLVETHGFEDVREILTGASVDEVFGRSLAELEAEHYETVPYTYPPLRDACDFLALPEAGTGHWHERVDITCDDEGISRFEGFWLSAVRIVELSAGRYELDVQGGVGARIVGCQDQAWPEPPPEMINGDVPNAVENGQTNWGLLFESGVTHALDLTDGRYKIVLPTWEDEETVEISLRRIGD
jgi:hypothetical protein